MPISGAASYLTTTDEFLGHWEEVDTTLGVGNELKLKDGSARAVLVTKKGLLVTKRTQVQAKINVQEVARGDIEDRKKDLLVRINQFNEKVRFLLGGTKWERALPLVPGQGDGEGVFTLPLDDAVTLWLMINDDPAIADITLLGAYTQAMFVADIALLNAAYTTYNAAVKKVEVVIEERNDIQDVIYEMLKQYRLAVPTYIAKENALLDSLPRLTPEPGSTPAAVTITVTWVPSMGKVKISFPASSSANIAHYSVRSCTGHTFSSDTENVIGTVPAGPGPFEFFTDDGLATVGDEIAVKVYTVNDTGNESGSNAVSIIRPPAV